MGHHTTMIAPLLFACFALGSWQVRASDPELTTDFAVPAGVNASTLDGNFFTSTVLRNAAPNVHSKYATALPVSVDTFPALQGLGVSITLLQFGPGAVNAPHLHPRGTEILFILEGVLDVGFVDTTNKLFTQTLQASDVFVIPKGLVHYKINHQNSTVSVIGSFSTSNPGLVRFPDAIFKSNISDYVLAKSFNVSSAVIDQLKAATDT